MTAAPNSPLVEKVARAMADVQRESEGKPSFSDEEWGKDFWVWYQELKGDQNGGSFVHQSWPAKLELQAQAALAACEAEAMRELLEEALLTSPTHWKPKARALLARLDAKP